MKWSIKLPTGEFLDTPEDFSLQFELNNQVFSTSDTSSLPGSFTFPVSVPLTPLMKVQLGFPNRIDSATRFSDIEGVWAYAGGIQMFYGTLQIKQATNKLVKINLVSTPFAGLKGTNLPEVDLEGFREVIPFADWASYMKQTANIPEDYDYIFMPVLNTGDDPLWNYWDPYSEVFTPDNGSVTPFVQLKYFLERMFVLADGWQFSNDWISGSLELGRLYIFNNTDVRMLSDDPTPVLELPQYLNLSKHVPDIPCPEFLKKLMSQWALGIFANPFTKKITLASLNDVLARKTRHDWTPYAHSDYAIDESGDAPGYYNYSQPESIPPEVPPLEDAIALRTATELNALLPLPSDYFYYVETTTGFGYADTASMYNFGSRAHLGVRVSSGSDYKAGMEALFDRIDSHIWSGASTAWSDSSGDWVWETNTPPIALMFFRGLQDILPGANRSAACGNSVWLDGIGTPGDKLKLVTDGVEVGEAEHSLNWHGEYGLYEKQHKRWSEMLRNGKPVTRSFTLPITTLTAFSFDEKIRVENMDFFAKRLRIQKLLDRGRVLVEATMISVI